MKKIRAAIVGYGNIGHYSVQALEAAPDFEIVGVVRRQGSENKPLELTPYEVVDDITKLKDVDVAIRYYQETWWLDGDHLPLQERNPFFST